MKKKVIIAMVFFAASGLLWYFYMPMEKATSQLPRVIESFASSTPQKIKNITQVFAPPPLTNKTTSPAASQNAAPVLTDSGVIYWTNINRQNNGNLPPLSENSKLDEAAENKLNDMFKQQYFDHVNPQGKGPSDLDSVVGYAYISIGENLAEGYFASNQDLLQAWMNSPGHRANILNVRYTQIGVAVGQGAFQGQKAWMAVQEFGLPASACPAVDANLEVEVNSLQNTVNQTGPDLSAEKNQLDSENLQTQAQYNAYNQEVAQYNSQINIYNNQVDTLKLDTAKYNAEVSAYNSCLGS